MLFNSLDFAVFLPLVFVLYWFVANKSLRLQNLLIVIASYIFYGWWDWRFLILIVFSTCLDFIIGTRLRTEDRNVVRKRLLWTSICVNLGLLGFFKYYNFFVENFVEGFRFFGYQLDSYSLIIILPVGISFYTFQTLSYTIDVYKRKLEPTHDFIQFCAFVSFFPQLVAGPIERATNLLPQFSRKRNFDATNADIGLRQIIWGLFKKVVIADSCAQYANEIFTYYDTHSSLTLVIGAICFAFQIYGDFSGYSDIAIGTARLFDISLMKNFKYPYFSRDIAEFWRRWHISLSNWFRDYVYFPLGGSRGSKGKTLCNVAVVFLLSGFWHGANWTFIVWGALHTLFFLPARYLERHQKYKDVVAEGKVMPNVKELLLIVLNFILVTFAWIFFRAASVSQAMAYIKRILAFDFSLDRLKIERFPFEIFPLIALLVGIEWIYRNKEFPLYSDSKYQHKAILIIFCIMLFGSFTDLNDFIYFQF